MNLLKNLPLVSVIIPVFRVEDYIERCLKSIALQTFRNVECILVDDCSPDSSMQKARDFLENSALKFHIIVHAENKGLSEARNSGIRAAAGKYVYFLDSDDEIAGDAIENLVKTAEASSAQITVGRNVVIREDGTEAEIFPTNATEPIAGSPEIFAGFVAGKWPVMAWDRLILRSFIIENNLFFEPGILSEDELWSFQCALKLEKIAFWKGGFTYFYFFREGSIIKSKGKKHFDSFQRIAEKFFAEFQKTENTVLKKLIARHLINFKNMTLTMNWEAKKNPELWKESYRNFRALQSWAFPEYLRSHPLQTKKKALYTSLPTELGFWLFKKRYGN